MATDGAAVSGDDWLRREAELIGRHEAEVGRLTAAIRSHRDQRGDDRCWLDDLELYKALGDGPGPSLALPCREAFLESCARYWKQRQSHVGPYEGPPTIAQLEAALDAERRRAEAVRAEVAAGLNLAADRYMTADGQPGVLGDVWGWRTIAQHLRRIAAGLDPAVK